MADRPRRPSSPRCARCRAAHDHLFTSGGIGPTHDDITADCVAAAMGAAIDVRDDARAMLAGALRPLGDRDERGAAADGAHPRRRRPDRQPGLAAPGFSLGNVHVMAGVPRIFEAMVAGLLPRLTGGTPLLSQSLPHRSAARARSRGRCATLAEAYPDLAMGSYPFQGPDGSYGASIVIRGTDGARLDEAMARLAALFPGVMGAPAAPAARWRSRRGGGGAVRSTCRRAPRSPSRRPRRRAANASPPAPGRTGALPLETVEGAAHAAGLAGARAPAPRWRSSRRCASRSRRRG